MSLSFKPGVRLFGMSTPMVLAIIVVEGIYAEKGFDCVVTAGIDGKHVDLSSHYNGDAADFRTNNVPTDIHPILLKLIQDRLTPDFFAQIEVDHIHVQFRPRATYTG